MMIRRSNYRKIKEYIELYRKDYDGIREILQVMYVLAYKKILTPDYRDITIPLLNGKNNYFVNWVTHYNRYDKNKFGEMEKNINYTELFDCIDYGRSSRRNKRMKKRSSRVFTDFKKVCRCYGVNSDFGTALQASLYAFRECVINIRFKLPQELYNNIPDNLKLSVEDKHYYIKDLYCYNELKSCYTLVENISLSRKNLQMLQTKIVPYLFDNLYII